MTRRASEAVQYSECPRSFLPGILNLEAHVALRYKSALLNQSAMLAGVVTMPVSETRQVTN